MSIDFVDVIADIPRDHWGRPLVIPPDGGKPIAYTRCTTFVGCLEDPFNLDLWKQRGVAVGLAQREDLLLRVASLGPQPDEVYGEGFVVLNADEIKKWKVDLNEITKAALEVGGGSIAANVGTSLHHLTEKIDRGQNLGPVPSKWHEHLRNYEKTTSAFTALHIETFTVNDELKIGGTPDRIVTIDGLPGAYVGDLKSGSLDFGAGKHCMQLAVYARSLLYDPQTGQRTPYAQEVSPEWGVIIALNAKTGFCELQWINLTAGWEGVQIAAQVRAWRSRKDFKVDSPGEIEAVDMSTGEVIKLSTVADTALTVAIDHAATVGELNELYFAAGPAWTADHTARAAARKAVLA